VCVCARARVVAFYIYIKYIYACLLSEIIARYRERERERERDRDRQTDRHTHGGEATMTH
jgi:hypothetical protein